MIITGYNNELKTSLKSSVSTRFNSNLMMVDSIIENWEPLNFILERENETSRLDNIDMAVLNELKLFLMPFKHWSDYTESSRKPSLFVVWIAIDSIIKHCAVKDTDEHLTTMMKSKALCYIEKSFELHSLHRISTFLHPNFKNLRFASENLHRRTITEIREMLRSYSQTDFEVISQTNRRLSSSSTSTVESELSNYFNEIVDEDEIDRYIKLVFFSEIQTDPAIWWNDRKNDFPNLSRLAIAIHGIPASSTPSERSFSASGAIITDRRTNINPEAVEDLLIIRSDSHKFAENSVWK